MAAALKNRFRFHHRVMLWGMLCLVCVGCSGSKIKTYPISGKFEMSDGDISSLSGCVVEFMQEENPLIRSNGVIHADGTFEMETLYAGKIVSGAPEGVYTVRIILTDEDEDGEFRTGGMPIHRRFLDFKTSNWSVTVPGDSVSFTVSKS